MATPAGQANRGYLPRHAERLIETALADTRIVAIVGPRQAGKTTLARRIAAADGRRFICLDDEQAMRFAVDDSAGFLREYGFAAIDELQRAPNLILPLKKSVDEDPRPGRYLVTGSADLFRSFASPDSLLGRVETVELLPLSQSEIRKAQPPAFLAKAFAGDFPNLLDTGFTENLAAMVLSGGYPDILLARSARRRREKLLSWAGYMAQHDLPEIGTVRKGPDVLGAFVECVAAFSGQQENMARLAGSVGIDRKTAGSWLALLERMFLLRRLRAWHSNRARRLFKTPRLHFIDSGMLAALHDVDEKVLAADRSRMGPLLESFVFSELLKSLPHCGFALRLSHYRDKDGHEVDFVIENLGGRTVGLEVKAAATVQPRDFRGLRRLAAAVGRKFACGIVLHDGDRIFKIGDRLFAMPVKMLWESR